MKNGSRRERREPCMLLPPPLYTRAGRRCDYTISGCRTAFATLRAIAPFATK